MGYAFYLLSLQRKSSLLTKNETRMKKMLLVALLMVITVTAKALSYELARSEALFLSDKMAYELNLTASQYDAVFEINLDYYLTVGSHADIYGHWWKLRNYELQNVLSPMQYETFLRLNYFYRPLGWRDGRWEFRIYRQYHNRNHFLMERPGAYARYRGGSHFGPRPGQVPPGRMAPGRVSPDRMAPGRVSPDRMTPGRPNQDRVTPGRPNSDRVAPGRPNSDRVAPASPRNNDFSRGQTPGQRRDVRQQNPQQNQQQRQQQRPQRQRN